MRTAPSSDLKIKVFHHNLLNIVYQHSVNVDEHLLGDTYPATFYLTHPLFISLFITRN